MKRLALVTLLPALIGAILASQTASYRSQASSLEGSPAWRDTGVRLGELRRPTCFDVTRPDVSLFADETVGTFAYNVRTNQYTFLNALAFDSYNCPFDSWLYASTDVAGAKYRFSLDNPAPQPVTRIPAGIGPDGVAYAYTYQQSPFIKGLGPDFSPVLTSSVSIDGGLTWRDYTHQFGGKVESVGVAPGDVRVVYALVQNETPPTEGQRNYTVYGSTDGGLTWDRRAQGATRDSGSNDYGPSLFRYLRVVPGGPAAPVDLLQLVAIDHDFLTKGYYQTEISLSTDGGRSFRPLGRTEEISADVLGLQLVHTQEGLLRLEQQYTREYSEKGAISQTLTLSTDRGGTWQPLPPLPTPAPGLTYTVARLMVAPAAPANVFLAGRGPKSRLLYSPDGGHTWQQFESRSSDQYPVVSPYLPLTMLGVEVANRADPRLLTPLPGRAIPVPSATVAAGTYPVNSLYALDLPDAGKDLSAPVVPKGNPGSSYFPQTEHNLSGLFKQYWNERGGLAQQGYPLTEPFLQVSNTNGKVYPTQYFERAAFEYHSENKPPYNVLLSLLGVFAYKERYGSAGAPNQRVSTDNPRLFPETGKTIGGKFRDYWEKHGGLTQQGYPISDEFEEKSDLDGKTYTVQYFERAVFEWHPENAGSPYEVLLSQLGRERYKQQYGKETPAPTPAQPTPSLAP